MLQSRTTAVPPAPREGKRHTKSSAALGDPSLSSVENKFSAH